MVFSNPSGAPFKGIDRVKKQKQKRVTPDGHLKHYTSLFSSPYIETLEIIDLAEIIPGSMVTVVEFLVSKIKFNRFLHPN